MFIFKVQGVAKIPDYIQIRDEKYTLLAYCRADRPEKALEKLGLGHQIEKIKELIASLPYGKLVPLHY